MTAPAVTIVVVDDNELASELLGELLASLGHRVTVATTGLSALEACAGICPDILLTDIMLPDIDGYELALRLRAACKPPPLCVALSGLSRNPEHPGDEVFAAWIEKPADMGTLEAVISGLSARTP